MVLLLLFFAFSQNKITKAEEVLNSIDSHETASTSLLENNFHKELTFKKLEHINNPTDCDVFDESKSLTCIESSSTYQPEDDFDRLIQKGFGYATRLLPMLNDGRKGSGMFRFSS